MTTSTTAASCRRAWAGRQHNEPVVYTPDCSTSRDGPTARPTAHATQRLRLVIQTTPNQRSAGDLLGEGVQDPRSSSGAQHAG